jgi:diguanylate cyclase (GGDEF)-like protein/PAS domain S-box-containing protein
VKTNAAHSSHSVLAVTWPFLASMIIMLLISLGSIQALSAMRAYVSGLAIWIGAEGDANAAMHRYLTAPSDARLQELEGPIGIWEGDRAARLELLKESPDYAFARRGFAAGGNDAAEIDGMMWLFRAMRLAPAWQRPLQVWAEADQEYERYLPLKLRLRSLTAAGELTPRQVRALNSEIDAIHAPVAVLEGRFAQAVGDNARGLSITLDVFLALSTGLLIVAGYLAARRIVRRTVEMAASLRLSEKAAFDEHERAAVLLRSIGDAVISTDRMGIVQFLNHAAEQMTGLSMAEACGRPLEEVFRLAHAEEGHAPVMGDAIEHFMSEVNDSLVMGHASELIRRDGSTTPIGERAARLRNLDGEVVGLVLVMRDVTPERCLSDQLRHQATHDALTGLANRSYFEHQLEVTLQRCQTTGETYAAAFIDLDQFKIVNDTGGHAAGDELIRRVGVLIREQLREGDLLARLGGDEFGLVLPSCNLEDAIQIAERIRLSIEALRFLNEGRIFAVNASVGLVHNDASLRSATDVLRAADRACYAAKGTGRNRVHLYSEDDRDIDGSRGEMRWVARLHAALAQDRFVLYTQEIRSTRAREGAPPTSHEVLLRLRDEDGEIVLPKAFIPAAERFGLMPQLDRWVIEHAFAEQSRRARPGVTAPRCMINLSGASLDSPDLADFIGERLVHYQLPRGSIGFELTETAAISRLTTAVKAMNRLKELGCAVALDDFGSGMSSYSYLRGLPVDMLKIDGSFVRDMTRDAVAFAMVESMHKVARAMGIRTVAEWVENDATLAALKRMGVDYVQGRGICAEQPWSEAYQSTESRSPVPLGTAAAG